MTLNKLIFYQIRHILIPDNDKIWLQQRYPEGEIQSNTTCMNENNMSVKQK